MNQQRQKFKTFEEFRAAPNATVVFYGDWGGQVYATVPARLFKDDMDTKELHALSVRLEQVCWDCNISEDDPDGGAMFACRIMESETGVLGGMGGGWNYGDKPWFYDTLPDVAREFIIEKLI